MSDDAVNTSFVIEDKSFSDIAIEKFNLPATTQMKDLVELSTDDYGRLSCILPAELYGCVFVGHKATDLDSIASAVGCAELFHGVAARASNVNSESDFALKYWGIPLPVPFLEAVTPDSRICIVDHNQMKQCPDGLDYTQLVGCIDHHAMQGNTISTSSPIHIDIKPWGSACTIVAHMFFRAKRKITRNVAGMLLSGILSDTLNLRSPTTTEHDCLAVALLAKLAGVDNPNELARALFKAKSQELLRCTPHQLVRGDIKTFECRCPNGKFINISFGVIETTDVAGLIAIRDDLALELRALKKEENKDVAFVAFVDIVNLSAYLVLVGSRETHLAQTVFNGTIDPATGLMVLNGLVSRKKDFIPPLERAIANGYELPPLPKKELALVEQEVFGQVSLECGEHGCQTVRKPKVGSSADIAMRFVQTFRDYASSEGASSDNQADDHDCNDDHDGHDGHDGHGGHISTDGAKVLKSAPSESATISSLALSTLTTSRKRTSSNACEHDSDDIDADANGDQSNNSINGPRKSLKKVSSYPSLELSRTPSTPLHETLLDPQTAPLVENAVKDLVDSVNLDNVKHLINENFVLPTPGEYKDALAKIAEGDDPSLKFLVMAVAHAFEKQEDSLGQETL